MTNTDKTVVTNVTVVSSNRVSGEDVERILESSEHDNMNDYVEELEASVEYIIANKVFGDADKIPVLDVSTFVHDSDDYDGHENE